MKTITIRNLVLLFRRLPFDADRKEENEESIKQRIEIGDKVKAMYLLCFREFDHAMHGLRKFA